MKPRSKFVRLFLAASLAALAPQAGASPASDTARPKPRYGNLKPAPNAAASKRYGDRVAQPAPSGKAEKRANASRPRLYKAQSRADFHRTNGAPRGVSR